MPAATNCGEGAKARERTFQSLGLEEVTRGAVGGQGAPTGLHSQLLALPPFIVEITQE